MPQHDLQHLATPLKQQSTVYRLDDQLDRSNLSYTDDIPTKKTSPFLCRSASSTHPRLPTPGRTLYGEPPRVVDLQLIHRQPLLSHPLHEPRWQAHAVVLHIASKPFGP
ncbi:hypothetical protein [Kribbella sp. CA-294648]|uniref:hypothetical protein n=1 Tax=Kribbella sp. CA-294648 TaxID=3239948 RepID=UPI003D93E280